MLFRSLLFSRFLWILIFGLSLSGMTQRDIRADAPRGDTWEQAQAAQHGAVVPADTGLPAGEPDSGALGITPDQANDRAVPRVRELNMGAVREGVTRNYADHDPALERWFKAGVPVHPVISPRWECPRGTYDISKNEMSEWYRNWQGWCHDIFTHYKGRIFYYILDNEPDLAGDKSAVYTPAQAVEFTRIAYLEAKTIDPRIQIESPPTNSPETDYLQRMIQLGVGNYCDVIGMHIYGSQINDPRFSKPWRWMQKYGVYKPLSASEAGVAVTWGRGADGKRDPQVWRRNWQQLYYSQLKRFGISSTLLFSLYGTYDGDFSYVNPADDTPVEPIFEEVKYGNRRRVFANGGFEQPNAFQREWVILYDADADAAPAGVKFVHGDAGNAHSGSSYLALDTQGAVAPLMVQRTAADLKPGFTYTLSGWAETQGGAGATLSALGFDRTAGAREETASTPSATGWQKLTVRFIPTATWAVVRLTGTGGSRVKWDDVTLTGPTTPPRPTVPRDVTVFPTDRLVTLHWQPVANASAYNLYRADKRLGPYVLVHAGIVGDPFTDWGVANGHLYFYRLSAVNGAGEGSLSAPLAVTPAPASAVSMASIPLPDLTVSAITLAPAHPSAGDPVTIHATVSNIGAGPTPEGIVSSVTIRVDGTLIGWSDTHTPSILPGQSVILSLNGGGSTAHQWTASSGRHVIRAEVDDINRMEESNKSNNVLEEVLTVP
ncbi:MAG: CARDB domain-containing protein [Janthinobacterium lividum]